jgi:hypothetical protein
LYIGHTFVSVCCILLVEQMFPQTVSSLSWPFSEKCDWLPEFS